MKKRLLLILMLLIGTLATYSQNFGEFIVNSHIDSTSMSILYQNCDSLNITPVFHYFYSDDPYLNDEANIRRRAITGLHHPSVAINGIQLVNSSYQMSWLYDINKWIPLLNTETSEISFDAVSSFEYLNPQETVLNFRLINLNNFVAGDMIYSALVQDVGFRHNIQTKMMPSVYGTEYTGQKVINLSTFWPDSIAPYEDCNVVVWVEQADGKVVFSKELPILNEYENQLPTLTFELNAPGAEGEPSVLNWWYLDLSKSTDYEDDINGEVMMASIKWEESAGWTPYAPINQLFEYRFRAAGTYYPIFKLVDSDDGVVTDSTEVTISWISGVETIANGQNISIYPNPFTDIVTLESNDMMKTVSVYSIEGKIILSKDINDNSYQLNTSDIDKGNYIIKVNYNDSKIKESIYKVLKN